MSVAEDKLTRPEPRRDRWGRYLIGGTAHTRATTVSGTLADTFALTAWKQRMVAVGLAKRADLHAMVASTAPDDKNALNKLCEDAMEAAEAGAAANLGTALHAFIAQVNDGHDVTPPAMWTGHLDAYRAEIARLGLAVVPGMVEQTCVLSGLAEPIAGTFDLLAHLPGRALPMVCDLKTGGVEYGATEFAVQLAIYANAQHLYDPDGDTLSAMPAVDRERALIIHLPAKADPPTCTIYELDIASGWERVQTALEVRAWRKRKDLLVPFSGMAPEAVPVQQGPGEGESVTGDDTDVASGVSSSPPPGPAEMRGRTRAKREHVVGRITALDADRRTVLAARWPAGVPTLRDSEDHTLDQLEAIQAVVGQVEAEAGLPFTEDPDPEMACVPADDPSIVDLISRIQGLPSDLRAAIEAEAKQNLEVPNLRSGRARRAHVAAVAELVAAAEAEWAPRAKQVTDALSVLEHRGVDPVAVLDHLDPGDWTEWHAARVVDLADTEPGFLTSVDGRLVVDRPADLLARFTNRREALNAARAKAKELGLPAPKDTDTALADPLLAAALAVA